LLAIRTIDLRTGVTHVTFDAFGALRTGKCEFSHKILDLRFRAVES
jgi:hypothetical protein